MKYGTHDIGKILGLLMLSTSLVTMLESILGILFGVNRILDLGFILTGIVGVGLYNHKNWARLFLLGLSYLGIAVSVVIGIIYPIKPDIATIETNFRGQLIANPAMWKVYIVLALAIVCFGLIAYFLRTEKARSEFSVA
ncbi:MAG: hypothetical protein ACOY90_13895 [Candidatus Zhuqueibacterota bacterium]